MYVLLNNMFLVPIICIVREGDHSNSSVGRLLWDKGTIYFSPIQDVSHPIWVADTTPLACYFATRYFSKFVLP